MEVRAILVQIVVLAFLGFLIYHIAYGKDTPTFKAKEPFVAPPSIAVPARAAPQAQPPLQPPIQVAPAGPNPPNVAPPPTMPTKRADPVTAMDPYDDKVEKADAKPKITYPERSFGPGIVPQNTNIAVHAGLASPTLAPTPQAIQPFAPEGVINGGNFFNDIGPIESDSPNFSAF